MQAIILAAGKGERLRPLTDTMPKCMIIVKDKPLIFHALDSLSANGKIDEIIMVIGYLADIIQRRVGDSYKGMKIRYIINDRYETTNNVYSLYLARNSVRADCVLLECDLFYRQDAIDIVVEGKSDCSILVSSFHREIMDGTVVFAENGIAKQLVVKAHQDSRMNYDSAYKTVNIYKFTEQFFKGKFVPALETYVKTGNLQSYYELVLGSLIYYRNDDIRCLVIDEKRWYEIDDLKDYERVNQSEL